MERIQQQLSIKTVNNTQFKTEFNFDEEHSQYVKDVLTCLEGKTFEVLTGDGKGSLVTINILEWLPIVLEKVGFDSTFGRLILKNEPAKIALSLLMVLNGNFANAFVNEIIISRDTHGNKNLFCYVLAHEISHVIRCLYYTYPLTTNPKDFLFNIMRVESILHGEDANSVLDRLNNFVIELDKSEEAELKILESFYGTSVKEWYTNSEMPFKRVYNNIISKPIKL